jgi:hypothetical protein
VRGEEQPLPLTLRKEIFRTLVAAQLELPDDLRPRQQVAGRFAVTPEQVYRIELEGTAACWPPLD